MKLLYSVSKLVGRLCIAINCTCFVDWCFIIILGLSFAECASLLFAASSHRVFWKREIGSCTMML
jgi:hypothetical protein